MHAAPLFSVIIPLEFHRGQWQRCVEGWKAQSLPQSQYEIIVVVPPKFPQTSLQTLTAIWPQARLEYSRESHDIGLVAAGAAAARGQVLVFTEAHCWPESDVLEVCLRKLTAEPDLAGFSCNSTRITHNRLSEAEAEMYDTDIAYGWQHHPWLKILDQCFVTRREHYEHTGGFDPELGHFAEWVLSAEYFLRGYKVGHELGARFNHYYVGDLGDLTTFTRDFTAGEMRFHSERREGSFDQMFVPPAEWWHQGSWSPHLARRMLRIALHSAWRPHVLIRSLPTLRRWIGPASFGIKASLTRATTARVWTLTRLQVSRLFGSKANLKATFTAHIAALIREERLAAIHAASSNDVLADQRDGAAAGTGWDVFTPANAGFYPSELHEGVRFRWSETAAIMPADIPAGRYRVRIECVPVRPLQEELALQFYVNERPITGEDVSIDRETIDIKFTMPQPGPARLAWTCLPFPATGHSRRCGLPIKRIVWEREPVPADHRLASPA